MRFFQWLFLLFVLTTAACAGTIPLGQLTSDITTTKNIGVGTTAPTQRLEVMGTAKATTFQGNGGYLTGMSSSQVGLSAVNNTADLDKPISTATQAALDAKMTAANYNNVENTSDLSKPISTAAQSALNLKVNTSLLGAANGVATLGSDSKVTPAQLPASITGALNYKGTLDASGGAYPGGPSKGDYYVISVAGTISGTTYTVGDWAVYNGSSWDKVDNASPSTGWTASAGQVVTTTGGDNVGIGSSSPSQKLDVGGSIKATSFIGPVTGDVTGNVSGSASTVTGAAQSSVTSVGTLSNLQVSGAIGVGSTSPSQKLDIGGNVYASGSITSASGFVGTLSGTATSAGSAGTANSATTAGTVTTAAQPTITSVGTLSSLLVSGNVGVGSTSPRAKVDVNGAVYGTTFFGNLTGTASTATAATTAGTVTTAAQPTITSVGTLSSLLVSGNVGVGSTSPAAALDMGSGGIRLGGVTNTSWPAGGSSQWIGTNPISYAYNVGIGSTSPQSKLDVNGVIYTSSLSVTGVGQSYCGSTYSSNCVYVGANANGVRIDPMLYTTGTIGIGTSAVASAQSLDVNGSAVTRGVLNIGDGSVVSSGYYGTYYTTASNFGLAGTGTASTYVSSNGYSVNVGNSTTPKMVIASTGNVGVGTSIPQDKLSVETDGNIYLSIISTTGTNQIPGIKLQRGSWNGATLTDWAIFNSSGNLNLNSYLNGETANTTLTSSGNLVAWGNVGINSLTPQQRLDVEGSVYVLTNVGIGSALPGGSLDVGTGTICINHTCNSAWPTGGGLTGLTNGKIPKASSATTVVDSQIYDNATNIGIGSTVPQQKLDVEGSVYVLTNIGIGSASPRSALDVNGIIYGSTMNLSGTGNVGIGSTSPTTKLQVGVGTPRATYVDPGIYIQGTMDVEGAVYLGGIQVISGNNVCYNTTTKSIYVKSTCP